VSDFQAVNNELWLYDPSLKERPMVVALNKIDRPEAQARLPAARAAIGGLGYRVFAISAATGEGVDALVKAVADLLSACAQDVAPHSAGSPTEKLEGWRVGKLES